MGDAARVILDQEKTRRREARVAVQSKADVDEINRRMDAFEVGKTKMYTRKEAKAMLEDMGYRG